MRRLLSISRRIVAGIAKDDMAQFSRAVERDFTDLAARYYLNLCGDPKIRVSRDRITVTFDLAKEE